MKRTYPQLDSEVEKDLISFVHEKLCRVDWDKIRPETQDRYLYRLMKRALQKELREHLSEGRGGRRTRKAFDISVKLDTTIPVEGQPTTIGAMIPSPMNIEREVMGSEYTERAQKLLSDNDYTILCLMLGLDGGSSRTPHQVVYELRGQYNKIVTINEVRESFSRSLIILRG